MLIYGDMLPGMRTKAGVDPVSRQLIHRWC